MRGNVESGVDAGGGSPVGCAALIGKRPLRRRSSRYRRDRGCMTIREARIRFDRNELAGSFGDIGTDLPLIVAMIPAAGLNGATVFVVFGVLQVLSGLLYGLPMPMQPLKAMAVIVITQGVGAETLWGGGLAIGLVMGALALTPALGWLVKVIPPAAVRGVQLGLGLALTSLALRDYVPSLGVEGYVLAGGCFLVVVVLWGSRRWPSALIVIVIGLVYAAAAKIDWGEVRVGLPTTFTTPGVPRWEAVWTGLVLLALPQLPLSLSNAVIATRRTAADLFPARPVSIRKLGLTYAAANVASAMLGGVPVCQGCGGLAGHHAFGARTGGSVVIYGAIFIVLGMVLGDAVGTLAGAYPRPVLGVILLVEAVALMLLVRDMAGDRSKFTIVLLVGASAFTLPQGYLVGILLGTGLHYYWRWRAVGAGGTEHP